MHRHNEIDTARFYGAGSSETMLGELDWKKRGIVMDTKYYPTRGKGMPDKDAPEGGWSHEPEHLRTNLMKSLKELKTDKLDMVRFPQGDRHAHKITDTVRSGICMGRIGQQTTKSP